LISTLLVLLVACGRTDSVSTQSDEPSPRLPREGKIAFASDRDGDYDIYVMNAHGSNPRKVTFNSRDDLSPSWSPDGSSLVYASFVGDRNRDLYVVQPNGANRFRLSRTRAHDEYDPAWSPNGRWIAFAYRHRFGDEAEIMVIRPDGTGFRKLIANDEGSGFFHDPAWSPDGERIVFSDYVEHDSLYVSELCCNPPSPSLLVDAPGADKGSAAWSPDGSSILFSRDDVSCEECSEEGEAELIDHDLFVVDEGHEPVRLEEEPSDSIAGGWAPDGSKIVFFSDRNGSYDIYIMNADGSAPVRLTESPGDDIEPVWVDKT
jgi:TolB protein